MPVFDKRKDSRKDRREDRTPAEADRSPGSPPPQPPSQPEMRAPMPHGVSAARDIAVIGRTITIKGVLTGEESLVIDGRLEGRVVMRNNDLTVGQTGQLHAEVTANMVRVEGELTGDITGTQKAVVTRTGRVRGNIRAPRVTLEDGARFRGHIDMDASSEPAPAAETLKSVPTGQPPGFH